MNNRKLKAKRALITGATGYIGSNYIASIGALEKQ